MGVIADQVQFWFQFHRHNKTQTPPPPPSFPTSGPCPAVLIGRGGGLSVSVFVVGVGGRSAWRAVDGLGCVILEERLQEHAHRAKHAHEHKDPQEEAVDHHGNVLPVFTHLWMGMREKREARGVMWDGVRKKH